MFSSITLYFIFLKQGLWLDPELASLASLGSLFKWRSLHPPERQNYRWTGGLRGFLYGCWGSFYHACTGNALSTKSTSSVLPLNKEAKHKQTNKKLQWTISYWPREIRLGLLLKASEHRFLFLEQRDKCTSNALRKTVKLPHSQQWRPHSAHSVPCGRQAASFSAVQEAGNFFPTISCLFCLLRTKTISTQIFAKC